MLERIVSKSVVCMPFIEEAPAMQLPQITLYHRANGVYQCKLVAVDEDGEELMFLSTADNPSDALARVANAWKKAETVPVPSELSEMARVQA